MELTIRSAEIEEIIVILVTGGLGFIGSHTVQALLDMGESCVLGQRRQAGTVDERAIVERVDINDRAALLEIGDRHKITGIVHLAGSIPWPPGADEPLEAADKAIRSLFNVVHAAREWGVARVCVASTIGVYMGIQSVEVFTEDMPLRMESPHVIPAFKKIGELLTDHFAATLGLDLVSLRIGAIWGPGDRTASPFFAAPQLVHAAVNGTSPDLSTMYSEAHAEDAIDLCYVKDCGRAIALLQLAENLNHRTYNVSSGRATTNAEVITAIKKIIPDARVDLPTGSTSESPYLDITRIAQDVGYAPEFDTDRAVADYIGWLRASAGH